MEEEKREKAKGGLDEREYWLTKVYDEESALKFYQLYYPKYPDVLMMACAAKIAETVEKGRADLGFAEQFKEESKARQAAKKEGGPVIGDELAMKAAEMKQASKKLY